MIYKVPFKYQSPDQWAMDFTILVDFLGHYISGYEMSSKKKNWERLHKY